MADSFGNLIKIWGGATETAVDIAGGIEDGMLAYCPLEKVAVWKKDATTYEKLTSEARVLEIINANVLTSVAHDTTLTGSGTAVEPLGVAIPNVSATVTSSAPIVVSTSSQVWGFTTTTATNNSAFLATDDTNNTITFKKSSVRYKPTAYAEILKGNSDNPMTITIESRRFSNNDVLRTFVFPVDWKKHDSHVIPLPINAYDNTEDDYEIYYVLYGSDTLATITSITAHYETAGEIA